MINEERAKEVLQAIIDNMTKELGNIWKMSNEDIRDCNNCIYYVALTIGMTSQPIEGCRKWECDFIPKVETEKQKNEQKNL